MNDEIRFLSFLLLYGCLIDCIPFFFTLNGNIHRFLRLAYSVFFPAYTVFCLYTNVKYRTHLLIQTILILMPFLLSYFFDYKQLISTKASYPSVPVFILHILSVFFVGFKLLEKRKKSVFLISYLFLLMNFLSLQSVATLALYNFIEFDMKIWLTFKTSFVLYIALMRIVYMTYVFRKITA